MTDILFFWLITQLGGGGGLNIFPSPLPLPLLSLSLTVEHLKVLRVEHLKVRVYLLCWGVNSRACLRILNSRAPKGPYQSST